MSQPLRGGVRTLSSIRAGPARVRQDVASLPRWQTRCVQIRAAPSEQPGAVNGNKLAIVDTPNSAESAAFETDARFDVIGAPYSLLSVSLSASQNLYTRRGTLVGLSGKADNVVSTLSVLGPFRRAVVGIPFLYQKVSSASPVTALVSVRSPITSFAVVRLDGSVDWMIAQRRALLAWTGRSLTVRPTINTNLSLAHWGSSEVTGRGLLALVGTGQIYSVELKAGEQYIVHPSNVVAYTISSNPPRPYRFKSTTLKFQVPGLKSLPNLFQNSKFIRDMSDSNTWKSTMRILHKLRTWLRMTVWGDRLFLQFDGPTQILLQTRGPRINDIMSTREINEIADTPRGLTFDPTKSAEQPRAAGVEFRNVGEEAVSAGPGPSRTFEDLENELKGISQSIATLTKEGKVIIEKIDQKH
ncbi:Altered inheritance of mitochondria protein 24, mitochondrial [Aspergillus turcosus]|uniref:Altered inheritance of mitochondria protein 24, mitochondrial n=1 Tax=Aspergillus turcosus TaxID=1245748 RepID=A0A397I991_9EURO|nr:Altered inheritance of mitochondria protein 24, mitochondrial [Aspergillus turcosus]RLM01138.1 Altered inheritance of mitochondria protein 24, mitochondrial [Aspergillus turcosus]